MAKPVTLEALIEYVNDLELRIAALEQESDPEVRRKHTLSVLRDVLSDQLQDMSDDEFVEDEDDEMEKMK